MRGEHKSCNMNRDKKPRKRNLSKSKTSMSYSEYCSPCLWYSPKENKTMVHESNIILYIYIHILYIYICVCVLSHIVYIYRYIICIIYDIILYYIEIEIKINVINIISYYIISYNIKIYNSWFDLIWFYYIRLHYIILLHIYPLDPFGNLSHIYGSHGPGFSPWTNLQWLAPAGWSLGSDGKIPRFQSFPQDNGIWSSNLGKL